MTTFAYIARDTAGQKITGRLSGASSQAVVAELTARELAPVEVREVRDETQRRRKASTRQLATSYRQLADLLRAGVPLLRALRVLSKGKANAKLAAVIRAIADDIADGSRFADAMSTHPEVFPTIQVAMIRAGERGGFLEQVLTRMADFLEHQADLRANVLGSLIYPCLLLVIGLIIVIVALLGFVPKFQEFYVNMELPLPTRILLWFSAAFQEHWLLIGVLVGLTVFGFWWLLRQETAARQMAAWQLKIPMLGPLVRSLAVARCTRILGTLLDNGVPLLPAMQISRDATGHILLAESMDAAAEAVRSGESLSKPLGESGLFGEDVVEMIAVGEASNNLAVVLLTVAETIEQRVQRMLMVFLRLMEPLLLLCLGGVVLFIAIALIVPMLRMSSAISG